jgi:hypothetical protein
MTLFRVGIGILFVFAARPVRAADEPRAPEVDAAVNKALAYLRQSQQRDGCWLAAGFGAAQSPGVTGLCVMAFLSAGHTPTEGPHAPAITAGIRWVLRQQQRNGVIGASDAFDMYHHGICTLMLAEVVGMTDGSLADEIRQKLVKAVELILRAQRTSGVGRGGWRYTVVGTDADLSVTGWQLLALRAARNVGCDVPSAAIDRAIDYVKNCYDDTRGAFAYMPASYLTIPCTGTGVLCLELAGKVSHRARESLRAGSYILRNPPALDQPHCFYGLYYCSQAMFQLGENYWDAYRAKLLDLMLKSQQMNGSWVGKDLEAQRAGGQYSTAMAVLALTVEYRLLPIYQRGEDGTEPARRRPNSAGDKR